MRNACLLLGLVASLGTMEANGADPKVDLLGDRLPSGAIARLGTTRFRHGGSLFGLRYSNNGTLMTAWSDNSFYVWDAESGRRIRVHDLVGLLPIPLPNKTMLVADGLEGVLRKWDYVDLQSSLPSPTNPRGPDFEVDMGEVFETGSTYSLPHCSAVSPDGNILALASKADERVRSEIKLLKLEAGKRFADLDPLPAKWRASFHIHELRFSPDGRQVIAIGSRKRDTLSILVGDVQSPHRVRTVILPNVTRPYGVSADGKQVAVVNSNQQLAVVRLASPQDTQLLPIPHAEHNLEVIVWSPDGKLIAGGGKRRKIWVWDPKAGGLPRRLAEQRMWVRTLVFSPDGKTLASNDGFIRRWDVETGKPKDGPVAHQNFVTDAALSPDGGLAATCSFDGTARIWDTATGAQKRVLSPGVDHPPMCCLFSPDGSELSIVNRQALVVMGTQSLKPKWRESLESNPRLPFQSLSYSADGSRLAVKADTAMVWDTTQQHMICQLGKSAGYIQTLSPDGKQLAGVLKGQSAGSTVLAIWDVETQKVRKHLIPRKGNADAIQFSPDGKYLVMSGHSAASGIGEHGRDVSSPEFEDSLILWDVETGTVVRKFGWKQCPGKYSRIANDVTFSSDGKYLITAENYGKVLIYETVSGKLLVTLQGHERRVRGVAISANGKRLLSVSDDQTGLVWDFAKIVSNAK